MTLPPLFHVRRGAFVPQPQLSFVASHDAVTRRLHSATRDFQLFSRRGCVSICCSPTVCGAPPQGTPHEQNTSALRTLETITEFFAKGITRGRSWSAHFRRLCLTKSFHHLFHSVQPQALEVQCGSTFATPCGSRSPPSSTPCADSVARSVTVSEASGSLIFSIAVFHRGLPQAKLKDRRTDVSACLSAAVVL